MIGTVAEGIDERVPVLVGEGTTSEGGTDGTAGEGECPKLVDVCVFVGEGAIDGVIKGVAVGFTDGEGCDIPCCVGGKVDVAPSSKKARAKARTGANIIFLLDQLTGAEPSSFSFNSRYRSII